MSTQTATQTREVTVVSTRGERKIISTSATKWLELKKQVEDAGYNLNNSKCMESIRKNTLESKDALLPEGNFHLFIMPYKSKSGAGKKPAKKAKKAAPKKAAKKVIVKKAVKKVVTKKVAPKKKEAIAKVVKSVSQYASEEEERKVLRELSSEFNNVEQPYR